MALNPYDLFDVRSLLSEEERAVQDAVAAVMFLQLTNLDHAFFLRPKCCSIRRRPYTSGRLISR